MYYIYHIAGVKIGCSKNPKQRVKKQGFTEYTILEQHEDINVVSIREIELQKEYGYTIDNTLYSQTVSSPTIEGTQKGGQNGALKKWQLENPELYEEIQKKAQYLGGKARGSIQGNINKENGHMSNLGNKMVVYNNRTQECFYCGMITRGVGVHKHKTKCLKNPDNFDQEIFKKIKSLYIKNHAQYGYFGLSKMFNLTYEIIKKILETPTL
jgi:hypothetical protein